MDILHLIDRLEELFNNSKAVPLTRNVMVDEDKMLDIIDQMRIAIPDEVKKAQQLLAQKDRVMAQAQEEANRTVEIARQKADDLVHRDVIVVEAQRRAGSDRQPGAVGRGSHPRRRGRLRGGCVEQPAGRTGATRQPGAERNPHRGGRPGAACARRSTDARKIENSPRPKDGG